MSVFVRIADIDPHVTSIQPESICTGAPFWFRFIIPIGRARSPGRSDQEQKQQRQPERGIKQQTECNELDDQQRRLGSARRPSLHT